MVPERDMRMEPSVSKLAAWLERQLPGPDDIEELGYGAWRRSIDGAIVERSLDLRPVAPEYQEEFCQAVVEAN